MSLTMEDMTDIQAMWVDAEEPAGGELVPEGNYIARVDVCRPERSQSMQRMLKWELCICAGPYTGRTLYRNNMLETAQNIGWLKADLRKAGVDVDNPGFDIAQFIVAGTSALIGKLLKITVKKGKPRDDGRDNWNVYLNAVATEADVAAVNVGNADAAKAGPGGQTGAGAVLPAAAGTGNQPAAANPWVS